MTPKNTTAFLSSTTDQMNSDPRTPLHFGRFRLDGARRILQVDGRPAKLRARALDVLVALAERRDRVVSKEELLNLVWAGLVVEENNLQVHICALRKLLGPEAIVTVPGRGYQFVAAVDGPSKVVRPTAQSPHPDREASDADTARTVMPEVPPVSFRREQDGLAIAKAPGAMTLVILSGAAGIGKTAFAQEVEHQRIAIHANAVCWVDLSALREPERAVPLLRRVLGITEHDATPVADA